MKETKSGSESDIWKKSQIGTTCQYISPALLNVCCIVLCTIQRAKV